MPYQPSEDTFLLYETLSKLLMLRRAKVEGRSFLEVGVGSGYIVAKLAAHFHSSVGSDISLKALREARRRLREEGAEAELVCCRGAEAFRSRSFDLIAFNPPYLPTLPSLTDESIDGGAKGYEVALEILGSAHEVLKEGGRILFVLSSLSSPKEFLGRLKGWGVRPRLRTKKRLFFEELRIYELVKRAGEVLSSSQRDRKRGVSRESRRVVGSSRKGG